jgi:hypothetical protein
MPAHSKTVCRSVESRSWGGTGTFLESFDQLQELMTALVLHESPRADALFRGLENSHPEKPAQVLTLARKYGFTPGGLTAIWREHLVREAQNTLYKSLLKVTSDLVEDALNTNISCPRCGGRTTVYFDAVFDKQGAIVTPGEFRACLNCDGKGTVRKSGSDAARRIIFETIGVIGRAVIVQQDFIHTHHADSVIDELERAKSDRRGRMRDAS